MKVRFRQSGGFAGLSLGCDLDTAALPSAEAKRLEGLVRRSRLRATARHGPQEARDLVRYEVTVETPRRTLTVSFDDLSTPQTLEPLLDYLKRRATPRSPG